MTIRLSRRAAIGTGLLGAILLSGFILHTTAKTRSKAASTLPRAIVEVLVDQSTLSGLPTNGPFYMKGQVFLLGTLGPDGTGSADAEALGTWHCWGYANSGTGDTVESQTFMLDGYQGKIQVQGPEGVTVLPVTGGTGSFKGARGEATFKYLDESKTSFRVYFDFVEDRVCDGSHCQHMME